MKKATFSVLALSASMAMAETCVGQVPVITEEGSVTMQVVRRFVRQIACVSARHGPTNIPHDLHHFHSPVCSLSATTPTLVRLFITLAQLR